MKTTQRDIALPAYLRPAALVAIVLALTLVRLWVGSQAGLAEDEAYYRLWGLSPAFGYLDHPPMVGWWIALGQTFLGDTALAVRITGILAAALGSLVLWRTADILFGRTVAGWSVLLFNATVLIGVGSLIATPDAPSVFFWGLGLWAVAELIRSQNPYWWLAVGLFAGLGLVSKYSVLFFGAGLVLWLLFMAKGRRWLTAWQLWVGGALAVLVFLPVLLWNAGHEWASFAKQFGRAVPEGFTLKYLAEFVGALAGLLNPLVALLAVAGFVQLVGQMRQGDEKAGLIVLGVLPFIAYLVFHSFHARVQGNWPAPLFPAFAMMAGVAAANLPKALPRFWRGVRQAAVPLGIVVSLLVMLHAAMPFTGAFARRDPTHQTRGWEEIAAGVERIAADQGAAWVASNNYAPASQLAFALRGRLPVEQLNERIRYVMQAPLDEDIVAKPALFITRARNDPGADYLRQRFGSVERLPDLTRQSLGTPIEDLVVYRVADPVGDPRDPVFPAEG
ncbi:glycosyltransferase family 39 protein [Stappia sp. F7233]|uniref:Glycosyltransferase family 39 protein n=1 Tax=Stappia albiluteola TaxID=2758565 RepID=A0A839AJ19_9HYPH|nr:glycosyltransferase family 39 protein [Stappia albiluteola]MBA5779028.1 glycosyltransferase family 39 protein [Stappia albiluteola]